MVAKNVAKKSSPVKFEDLPRLINKYYDACQNAYKDALAHALKVGKYLLRAQEGTAPGQWKGYLDVNCPDIEPRVAQHYMKLALNRKTIEGSGVESLRDAIKLLTKRQSEPPIKKKPVDAYSETVSQGAYADNSDEDEESQQPSKKVVTKKRPPPLPEEDQDEEPQQDEEEINNEEEDDRDQIIEGLQDEIKQLKAEITVLKSKPTSIKEIKVSSRDLRIIQQQIVALFNDDVERASEFCNNILADVVANLERSQGRGDDEDEEY
jgi:hypothetical protein